LGPLPPVIAGDSLPQNTQCYALVYEFERPADPLQTRVKEVTPKKAIEHLISAHLWSPQQLRMP
jgi:hypothetical protein